MEDKERLSHADGSGYGQGIMNIYGSGHGSEDGYCYCPGHSPGGGSDHGTGFGHGTGTGACYRLGSCYG